MALVVGTNTYGDDAGFVAYAAARGITIPSTEAEREILLTGGMDYIEVKNYSGQKYSPDQALQFPRSPTPYDVDLGTVPPDIVKAQYVIAALINDGESMFATVNNAIKRKSIGRGEIDTTYKDNVDIVKTYPQVDALLRPFLTSSFSLTRRY